MEQVDPSAGIDGNITNLMVSNFTVCRGESELEQ